MYGTPMPPTRTRRRPEPRNREPLTERDRAKALMVALVAKCGGSTPIERTRLYKGYWIAHLIHMDEHGAILSEWPVVKMPHGPGVERGAELLAELVAAGVLRERQVKRGPFTALAYTVADRKAAKTLLASLRAEELESVHQACAIVRDRTAKQLSDFSHERSRSWKAAKPGHELAIYADLVWDDEESDQLAERLAEAERRLRGVF
jgi:hypothetical protein